MSQTWAMRRRKWSGLPAAAVPLVIAGGAFAATLGGLSSGAGALPAQTSAPTTVPATASTAAPATTARPTATTVKKASATTKPATSTTVKAPTTTVPVTAAPVVVPRTKSTPTTVPPTTAAPTTTTTILGIGANLPAPAATIPLHTTGSNGHVDPLLAWLSGVGFALFLLLIAGRLFITRPGGRDRAPLV